ncbi:hypothetical protein AB0J52_26455 [Spirillospora sp. NPDC049652]
MTRMRAAGAVLVLAAVAFAGSACGSEGEHAAKARGASGGPSSAPRGTAAAGTAKSGHHPAAGAVGAGAGGPARPAGGKPVRKLTGVVRQASVRAGSACSDLGVVARTSDGGAASCAVKKGEKGRRWTVAHGSAPVPTGSVKAGASCSDVGAVAQNPDGKGMTCAEEGGKTRWAQADGVVAVPGAIRPGGFCAPLAAKGLSPQSAVYTCARKAGEKQARWQK